MIATTKEFGFCPEHIEIESGSIIIRSLPNLEQVAEKVFASDGISNDWIYAPAQLICGLMSDKVRELPYASRVFGLPKTHVIEHGTATSADQINFYLWALSFFVGMRLTTSGAGFLDATPLKPRMLVDFKLSYPNLTHAVGLVEKFWIENLTRPRCALRFGAAVNALFLGQNPRNLQFERFIYFYMAIDACYKMAKELGELPKKNGSHAGRIVRMCGELGIEPPAWAGPDNPDEATVVNLRNNTLHEALFMDAPLGFAVHGSGTGQNLTLEMVAFVCRLLVALIGGRDASYVGTPVNTRLTYTLDFE